MDSTLHAEDECRLVQLYLYHEEIHKLLPVISIKYELFFFLFKGALLLLQNCVVLVV